MTKKFWDNKYQKNKCIWGERPSELAVAAVKYLKEYRLNDELKILDIGCGYGRDIIYFSKHLKGYFLGIDTSEKGIEIARNTQKSKENINFRCCNFTEVEDDGYDIVFIANLYHLLKPAEREQFRKKIKEVLKPNGLLFLSAISINDREEYGKGVPVPDELHSFQKDVYAHFFTKEELQKDFDFMILRELYEQEYDEPHITGEIHHHISWILIGEFVDNQY